MRHLGKILAGFAVCGLFLSGPGAAAPAHVILTLEPQPGMPGDITVQGQIVLRSDSFEGGTMLSLINNGFGAGNTEEFGDLHRESLDGLLRLDLGVFQGDALVQAITPEILRRRLPGTGEGYINELALSSAPGGLPEGRILFIDTVNTAGLRFSEDGRYSGLVLSDGPIRGCFDGANPCLFEGRITVSLPVPAAPLLLGFGLVGLGLARRRADPRREPATP